MRTVISDLQALRNTIDSCIVQDEAQRDFSQDHVMQSYWQGKVDALKPIRTHLQCIINSEMRKVYGEESTHV